MTVRALPEELRAAVPAFQADVRIEIEDRVASELFVARHQRRREVQLRQGLPDRLVHDEGMWVLHERLEEQLQCVGRTVAGGEVPGEREPGPPVLRVRLD